MQTKNFKNIKESVYLLPRHSYSRNGPKMEPVSLIIIGSKKNVLDRLGKAGWYLADSINFNSAIKSVIATIFDSSYRTGPMGPAYIDNIKHRMGFERPTRSDSYRRRHHLRLWKTKVRIKKQIVWIGTISYDRGVGFIDNSLMPTHHISSNLKSEENFLARTLRIARPKYITLGDPENDHISTGDPYVWDGKALLIDLSRYAN
jgi:LssY C-terminus